VPKLWMDHVVRAVQDIDEAAARMEEEFGLVSVVGGRHADWGTGNRIVPLGATYIELIGVVDPAEAAADPIGRSVASSVTGGDRWLCWCVGADDLDVVAAARNLPLDSGSRTRPDGSMVRWRSAGFSFALANPSLPFFISWQIPSELHPGASKAIHRVQPEGISWVEVGDDERLERWVEGLDVPVRRASGTSGPVAVGIATASGDIVLR
jgi:Glyoxalase-like domain